MNPRVRNARITAAVVVALAGAALFQCFGNANHGYIDTNSLLYWWTYQWWNADSETQHGWLVLGIAGWLLWRNLRANPGMPKAEGGRRKAEGEGERRKAQDGGQNAEGGIHNSESGSLEMGNWHQESGAVSRPVRSDDMWFAPLGAMLGGLALHAVGFAAQQARLSILALLLFTWGVMRLGGGRRWGGAAAFPLAFLVFAIPLSALDSVGFWLRLWVMRASTAIAHGAGIEVLRNGTQIISPDGRYNYDVAAACSGIRSLMALAALSLLIGYVNFRGGWRRGLMLLLCFPLVYVGNVARITAIIFAAQAGGTKWGDLAHAVMGYAIFAIVLGGVLGAARLLERWWPEDREVARGLRSTPAAAASAISTSSRSQACRGRVAALPTEAPHSAVADVIGENSRRGPARQAQGPEPVEGGTPPTSVKPSGRAAYWYVIPAIVIVLAAVEGAFLHHLATMAPRGLVGVVLAGDDRNPVELPAFLGREWVGSPVPVSDAERAILPPDTGYSKIRYTSPSGAPPVFVSIVLSGRDRTSIHRPELCLVGQGWTIAGATEHRFVYPRTADTFPATILQVERDVKTPRGTKVVPQLVAYWFVAGDMVVATHWRRMEVDAWNRVVHARADRWAYVLMQTDAMDGEAAALVRMQAVLDATLPSFQRVR